MSNYPAGATYDPRAPWNESSGRDVKDDAVVSVHFNLLNVETETNGKMSDTEKETAYQEATREILKEALPKGASVDYIEVEDCGAFDDQTAHTRSYPATMGVSATLKLSFMRSTEDSEEQCLDLIGDTAEEIIRTQFADESMEFLFAEVEEYHYHDYREEDTDDYDEE